MDPWRIADIVTANVISAVIVLGLLTIVRVEVKHELPFTDHFALSKYRMKY